jgi:hypothetical protein
MAAASQPVVMAASHACAYAFGEKAADPLHRAGIDAEALGNAPHAGTTGGSQSLTDEVERTSIGGARKSA